MQQADHPKGAPKPGSPPSLDRFAYLLLFAERMKANPSLTAQQFREDLRAEWKQVAAAAKKR